MFILINLLGWFKVHRCHGATAPGTDRDSVQERLSALPEYGSRSDCQVGQTSHAYGGVQAGPPAARSGRDGSGKPGPAAAGRT